MAVKIKFNHWWHGFGENETVSMGEGRADIYVAQGHATYVDDVPANSMVATQPGQRNPIMTRRIPGPREKEKSNG